MSIALGFGLGCSGFPFAPRSLPDCPGSIRSTDEISGEFTNRYRVTVRAEDLDFPFELIEQKKGYELVLVGVSPLGATLFSVVQNGTETAVERLPRAALPIPPLNVLRDVHALHISDPNATGADATAGASARATVIDRSDCGYSIRFEALRAESPP